MKFHKTFQATYPAFIIGLPIISVTLTAQLRIEAPLIGMYSVISASLIPICNPITVLLIITSFRKRLLFMIRKATFMNGKVVELTTNNVTDFNQQTVQSVEEKAF